MCKGALAALHASPSILLLMSEFFARRQASRALQHRDFRLLFGGSIVVGFVMPMQFLTQIFWVQDH